MMTTYNYGHKKYAPVDTSYALIADPENSRMTQAYLKYTSGKTALIAGRQMVNLDDQRFVGAVAWRQMPQTFRAYTVTDSTIEGLNLMASYVTDRYGVVNGLSGETETVLLHASYTIAPSLKITGYDYMIGSNSDTVGAMATGKVAGVKYLLEAATQQDASLELNSNGKPAKDASYLRADVSTKIDGIILGAAYESFDDKGSHGTGFTTPLATLHKWQGFADVFLGYSAGSMAYGLEDIYGKIGYTNPKFGTLIAFYHNFSAKTTTGAATDKAGSEIDFVYKNKISKNLGYLIKGALFSGESNSVIGAAQKDVTKYWVQLNYKF